MRIERTGQVSRLTPRLERFFVEALGGKSLDDVQHAETRKADFKCLRGLLVIELKSLEEDGSERMNNLVDELSKRPDWPLFYGSVPMQAFLKNIDKPEEVKRRFVDRIGRAIKNHISKANKQLAAHTKVFPRRNSVKIVVLANEDHELYSPEMVGHIIRHLLQREEQGAPLYPNIDAVIFLTERHAMQVEHQIAFPIFSIVGKSIETTPWKRNVINHLLSHWAAWNDAPHHQFAKAAAQFTTIDAVPDQMKRQEKWQLEYKRNPYMRDFTDNQLRNRFDEVTCLSSLAFVKHSPLKPTNDAVMWSMSTMAHLMLEMGWRGAPMTQFRYEPDRIAAAARRLRLPENVIFWFETDMGRRMQGNEPT
jgi:hypothetical protein